MYTVEELLEGLGRSPWSNIFGEAAKYPEKFETTRRTERNERKIYGYDDIPGRGKVLMATVDRDNEDYELVDIVERVTAPDQRGDVDITIGQYVIYPKRIQRHASI